MPIDRAIEGQLACFAAWLENRLAAYLNGGQERMQEAGIPALAGWGRRFRRRDRLPSDRGG